MVCILLGTGFEETEALAPCDILRRGGADVKLVGVSGEYVTGGHGITVKADMPLAQARAEILNIEMIVVPGGLGGVEAIEASAEAMELVREVYAAGKLTAAICAGPRVLGKLGILNGKSAVCYPGMEEEMNCNDLREDEHSVICGNVITGRGPGSAMQFGFALLEMLKGKEAAENVKAAMHY